MYPSLRSLNSNTIGGYLEHGTYGKFIPTPEGPKAIAAALPHCGNLQSLRCTGPFPSNRVT
jgi:hypothetical protein